MKVTIMIIAVALAGCGGTSTSSTTQLEGPDPSTTRADPGPDSGVPDPCALLTVEEAAAFDSSITTSREPSTVEGATTRVCDFGSLSVTVAPGGTAGSLRYDGMEEEGTEAADIVVAGADGAVHYVTDGEIWQLAAVGPDHSVMVLLWTAGVPPEGAQAEQLRLLLETAFSRLP